MSNTYNGLTIIIPSDDYEEPESIRQEGQGSFKIEERPWNGHSASDNLSAEEKLTGKKRNAEGFSEDLPVQPTRNQPIINSK